MNIWPVFIMIGRMGAIWFKWGMKKKVFQSITTIAFFLSFIYTEVERRKKRKTNEQE